MFEKTKEAILDGNLNVEDNLNLILEEVKNSTEGEKLELIQELLVWDSDLFKAVYEERIEELRATSYDFGYNSGQEEGYEEGHSDGYEEGYERGKLDLQNQIATLI